MRSIPAGFIPLHEARRDLCDALNLDSNSDDDRATEILRSALAEGRLEGWFEHQGQMRRLERDFWNVGEHTWKIRLGLHSVPASGGVAHMDVLLLVEKVAFEAFVDEETNVHSRRDVRSDDIDADHISAADEGTVHSFSAKPDVDYHETESTSKKAEHLERKPGVGAPKGSGAIDDDAHIAKAQQLLDDGTAKSQLDAATRVAADAGLAQKDIDRIRKKLAKVRSNT